MSGLKPVSFKKGRVHLPRLSTPYVPGKRHERFWGEAEKEILKTYYPAGGASACKAHLPNRSISAIQGMAHTLGVEGSQGAGPKSRINASPETDDRIKAAWPLLKGRGAVNRLADDLKLPRWWISKRARDLGLANPHRKEPNWTQAEKDLLKKAPLHDLDRAAAMFKEHGFNRSATAIMVMAKRQNLSRRTYPELSGTAVAKILGVDNKTTTQWCVLGDLKASRRPGSKRLPQQGGAQWSIKRCDLREFIISHPERIDIRKVDQYAFIELLTNISADPVVEIRQGHGDHNDRCALRDGGRLHWMSAPPAPEEMLAPCPFCGCDYADTVDASGLEVANTHTPSFWIKCNACGTEHHPADWEFPHPGRGGYTRQMFVDARAAAVAAWNIRNTRWKTS